MSNWTHVAAIFRIDAFRFTGVELDFTEIFGRELDYHDAREMFFECDEHPEKFLPYGSEGSLHMSVWVNPDRSHLAAYTVSVFGDLRDHESIEDVINWFDEKCKAASIRQAVITVENEYLGTQTKTYER